MNYLFKVSIPNMLNFTLAKTISLPASTAEKLLASRSLTTTIVTAPMAATSQELLPAQTEGFTALMQVSSQASSQALA